MDYLEMIFRVVLAVLHSVLALYTRVVFTDVKEKLEGLGFAHAGRRGRQFKRTRLHQKLVTWFLYLLVAAGSSMYSYVNNSLTPSGCVVPIIILFSIGVLHKDRSRELNRHFKKSRWYLKRVQQVLVVFKVIAVVYGNKVDVADIGIFIFSNVFMDVFMVSLMAGSINIIRSSCTLLITWYCFQSLMIIAIFATSFILFDVLLVQGFRFLRDTWHWNILSCCLYQEIFGEEIIPRGRQLVNVAAVPIDEAPSAKIKLVVYFSIISFGCTIPLFKYVLDYCF